MKLHWIDEDFTISKITKLEDIHWEDEYCFYAQTDEENSLVCPTRSVPDSCVEREDGWRCFRIEGVLDFSLIGILSRVSKVLADHQIGIFVVSTFNTDYVLVKKEHIQETTIALRDAGYQWED